MRIHSFLKNDPVFQESKPIVLTSFVNKVGSIGLSLIPILLVSKKASPKDASFLLGTLKVTLILATLLSGLLIDRIGKKNTVLLAFLLSSIGLGLLPFFSSLFALLILGVAAQCGDALSRNSIRSLLVYSTSKHHHKSALSWVRVANNLGQLFSFGIGATLGFLGPPFLMLFDSMTSFIAFLMGFQILPKDSSVEVQSPLKKENEKASSPLSFQTILVFITCSLLLFGYSLFYEFFMSGISGRLEYIHPGKGLSFFSVTMLLNTILCTALAVPAAKYFHRPTKVFTFGLLSLFLGLSLAVYYTNKIEVVLVATLLVTGAEVAMSSLTQYTLIRLTPLTKNSESWYSFGMTISQMGKLIASSLVFPVLIQNSINPFFYITLFALYLFLLSLIFIFKKHLDIV